ncbi:MAG: antitoxin, ParD family [Methyloprofundus sp.]|nr:MAG: antitoxin, ParD family [Methyloprofundus sp.]
MATSVRLDDDLVTHARVYAEAESRSLPKQIEYWAKIGKIMIDNPDLSYEFVHESLLATEEVNQGLTKRYVRRTNRD